MWLARYAGLCDCDDYNNDHHQFKWIKNMWLARCAGHCDWDDGDDDWHRPYMGIFEVYA